MRCLALIVALSALASSALAAPLPPPIAPASSGKVQCYAPDRARKTCRSIAVFRDSLDGGVEEPSTVLISPDPVITMQTVSPVTIKNSQVCGFVRPEDISEATFSVGGVAATPEQSQSFRAKFTAMFNNGVFGHEICTSFVPDGDGLIAKVSIDGVVQPKMDQSVIWVSPSEGYHVGT